MARLRWAMWRAVVNLSLVVLLARAQDCYYVVDGGGLEGPDDAAECTEQKVLMGVTESTKAYVLAPEGLAGIRCCRTRPNNRVVGVSACDGEWCKVANHSEATARCAADGERLCTRDEVLNGRYWPGCAYESLHVWTSTPAECPVLDEPELSCAAVADGSGVGGPDPGECPGAAYDESVDSYAVLTTEQAAAVHCCGSGTAHCDAKCDAYTHEEALTLCAADGLCGVSELRSGILANKSDECGHLSMSVWSSDVVPCPTQVARFDLLSSDLVLLSDLGGLAYVAEDQLDNLSVRAVVAGYSKSVRFTVLDALGDVVLDQADDEAPYVVPISPILGEAATVVAAPFVGGLLEEYTDGASLSVTFTIEIAPNPTPAPTLEWCAYVVDGHPNRENSAACPAAFYDDAADPNLILASADEAVAGIQCCDADGGNRFNYCPLGRCQTVDLATAEAECLSHDQSLCTVQEIADLTRRSRGCRHNSLHIWSSEMIPCRPDPLCAYIVDGNNASDAFSSPCANAAFDDLESDDVMLIDATSVVAGTRCCDDDGAGYSYCPAGDCQLVDFATAEWECLSRGQRLCTVAEIASGVTSGTGCMYDRLHVWSSQVTECPAPSSPQPSMAPSVLPSSLPTLAPSAAPSSSPTLCGLSLESDQVSGSAPALYVVETVHGHVVQEVQDLPVQENHIYLHPNNNYSTNVLDATGVAIEDVEALTLVVAVPVGVASVVRLVLQDILNDVLLVDVERFATSAGYAALYGAEGCASWTPGLAAGVFSLTATIDSVVVLSRQFRIDPIENGNLVPKQWQPKVDDTGRVDVLDIVPFSQSPRVYKWNRNNRPFQGGWEFTRRIQLNRINFVMPGPGDGMTYMLMELTGMVYRVPTNHSLTFSERNALREEWWDLKRAIERATGGTRTLDLETEQHSGLRTIAWHPNFEENGLMYVSFLETWDDTIPPEAYLSLHDESDIVRAKADAVVAEFQVVNGNVNDFSYRQLLRVGYNETATDYAIYEHPVKECTFGSDQPPYVLFCGSGDGSVDSTIAFGGREHNIYGKIIAIDVGNGEHTDHFQYDVPAFNVWGNGTNSSSCCAAEHRRETYAIGLRNPHRITCLKRDGPAKGQCFVFDAGRDNAEECNRFEFGQPGPDFGWLDREGFFVHLDRPGIGDGVAPLPADDATYGYTYPSTFLGHDGVPGDYFTQTCGIGSHVVQTSSDLENRYFMSDFPAKAPVYYSMLDELLGAVTTGPPEGLTLANVYKARLRYFQDDEAYANNQPTGIYEDFRDISIQAPGNNLGPDEDKRADLRFGEGPDSELFIFSKRVGTVYIVKNSIAGVATLPMTS